MTTNTKPGVGFVGVGRMGANMALHLMDLGYRIEAVYDSNRKLAEEVAAGTGARGATLADVTSRCDVILTVVSDDRAMDRIFATSGDSLLTAAAGKVFINCATVTPAVHVEIERRAEAAGASAIEACMASSIPQAREGTLYLMVAGREATVEKVRPLLEDLSADLRYIGKAGEAAKVKALVNMVMNINTAGLAEGSGSVRPWGSISTCCATSSHRREPARASFKPTAPTCKTASTTSTSPPRTLPRIHISRSRWQRKPASTFRWRPRPPRSTTVWSRKVLETWTSRPLPS